MRIIDLTPEQMKTLNKSCKKLGINKKIKSDATFADNIAEIQNLCKYFSFNLAKFSDTIDDIESTSYDKNFEEAITCFDCMATLLTEILDDTKALKKLTQNTIFAFRDLTICTDYKMMCSEKEIKELIDENFVKDSTLSIGYKDGQFALLFCKVIDEEEQDPFLIKIIASGKESAYSDIEEYISTLINFEA